MMWESMRSVVPNEDQPIARFFGARRGLHARVDGPEARLTAALCLASCVKGQSSARVSTTYERARHMHGTVTKSELIERIAEKLNNMPNGKAEQIVNCVFDSMVRALQEGEGIEIRGFGSFTVREYKSYEGRNPRTGETVHVAPKKLPFFKVGKDLRERVNTNYPRGGVSDGVSHRDGVRPKVALASSLGEPSGGGSDVPL